LREPPEKGGNAHEKTMRFSQDLEKNEQKEEIMPTLRKGESYKEWMSRCIPYVIKEGKTSAQAKGQCYGMWKNRNRKPKKKS